jgi:hypothetical protein
MDELAEKTIRLKAYYAELMSYATDPAERLKLELQLRIELGALYLEKGKDPPNH